MRNLFLAISAILLSSSPAFSWGCEGHQMVALLARIHMTPVASNAVDHLLRENPVEVSNQFCKGGGDLMADVASWADAVRNAEKTGLWHYIDIPLEAHSGELAQWCDPASEPEDKTKDRPGCVTSAITYLGAILADTAKPAADRARALRYLIHFIGDMHQPLHTTDNNDHGGNCTTMKVFADERAANLHSIWDSRLIARALADGKMSPAQYATAIDSKYADNFKTISAGNQTEWAWDGHTAAEKYTYGLLKPAIPVEKYDPKADCNAEREKVAALQIKIDDPYYSGAMPVIDAQLAKGGYRLAAYLNKILTR